MVTIHGKQIRRTLLLDPDLDNELSAGIEGGDRQAILRSLIAAFLRELRGPGGHAVYGAAKRGSQYLTIGVKHREIV